MWIFRYIVKNQLFVKFVRWMDEFTSDPVLLVFNNFSVRSTKNETSKTKERITYAFVLFITARYSGSAMIYTKAESRKNFIQFHCDSKRVIWPWIIPYKALWVYFFAAIFCKFLLIFYEPFSILFYSHFAFCVAPFLSSGIFDSPWTCFLAYLFVISGWVRRQNIHNSFLFTFRQSQLATQLHFTG